MVPPPVYVAKIMGVCLVWVVMRSVGGLVLTEELAIFGTVVACCS